VQVLLAKSPGPAGSLFSEHLKVEPLLLDFNPTGGGVSWEV
jgi:hypothetical protein